MKTLNKKEKEIIQLIADKEICDIFSYLKYYNYLSKVENNMTDIENAFNNEFGQIRFRCLRQKFDSQINKYDLETIDDLYAFVKPQLTFKGWGGHSLNRLILADNHNDIYFQYDLLTPIYICNNIDKIYEFIAIWQYLESEHLIINLSNPCSKKDMAIFAQAKAFEKKIDDISSISAENLVPDNIKVPITRYLNWTLTLDEYNFDLCYAYLNIQLFPTLSLKKFIKNGFKTDSAIRESHNFAIALTGVIVAIITALSSIWISLVGPDYRKELQELNSTIQHIYDLHNSSDTSIDEKTDAISTEKEGLITNTSTETITTTSQNENHINSDSKRN